ncbi:hypothetical protein EDD16DRAFT_1585709 [Pisolithus croceorrhizus]|nr:hypothetical protein EDD16DRAFT_1585709 [Pisolithus croceorrhizus]
MSCYPVALLVWDLCRSKPTLSSPRTSFDMVQVVNYIRREGNMEVSGVTWADLIVIAISRDYGKFTALLRQQTQVMIKRTCGGFCMIQERTPQNISCGLMPGLQSKLNGQVGIGVLPPQSTRLRFRVRAVKHLPHR